MSQKLHMTIPLLLFTLFGCSRENAAVAASGLGFAAPGSSGAQTQIQIQTIKDPTLDNQTAYRVLVPARWHFQSALFQGDQCTPVPSAVYRESSPDGLSYVESLPPMSWQWGSANAHLPGDGCLPLHGALTAQAFLKDLATMLHAEYVAPAPVPEALNARVQAEAHKSQEMFAARYAGAGLQAPKNTIELARATVRFTNGTFAMSGRLNMELHCTETTVPGQWGLGPRGGIGHPAQMVRGDPSIVDKCTARVIYFAGPAKQFAAELQQWDAQGIGGTITGEAAWQQAWIKRDAAHDMEISTTISNMARANAEASRRNFEHDQQVTRQMHNQFLDAMQAQTDSSMRNAKAASDARTTAASDVVDYALDQRTVADPNTGQLTKISNRVSTSWSDGSQMFVSKDPSDNPNGLLPGTWTQQNFVHGNGAPQ